CILPSTDSEILEAALALARTAEKVGRGTQDRVWHLLALGMAEHRSGNYAAADEALRAADKAGPNNRYIAGISRFYRAMNMFRQGQKEDARGLAITAKAKMHPLPMDEGNPLADDRDHDDLILWLAYREANAMVQFEVTSPPQVINNKK